MSTHRFASALVGATLGLAAFVVGCDNDTSPTDNETSTSEASGSGGGGATDATGTGGDATGTGGDATGTGGDVTGNGGAGGGSIDATAPTLELLSPRTGIATSTRLVEVNGVVNDEVGVASLEYAINGGAPVQVELSDAEAFTFAFTPTAGENSLEVTARDAAGNATSRSLEVYFGHRVSCGNSQAATLHDGTLYTWGRNELGQLGNGTLLGTQEDDDPAGYTTISPAPKLVSIVTRQTFMIGLTGEGEVYTWGSNGDGELGYATPSDCGSAGTSACGRSPAQVAGISDAVAIGAGFNHSLVLRDDGTVIAFGDNSAGQLGIGSAAASAAPTAVSGLSDVIQVAAGAVHSLALTKDGQVYAWGSNKYGGLGLGTMDDNAHRTPVLVDGVSDVVALAATNYTTLALKRDGTLLAWGQNNNGQLGNGLTDKVSKPSPAPVLTAPDTPLKNIESIAGDGFVSVAVSRDGDIYTWGIGSLGQLGMGVTEDGGRDLANRYYASQVIVSDEDKPHFVVLESEVGAGGAAFALTTEGNLYAWGWSFKGSLVRNDLIQTGWAYTSPTLVFPTP